MCFVITTRARGSARFARDTIILGGARPSADSGTIGVPFFYVEFDPTTKKARKQVYCTIPAGDVALARALNEFTPRGADEALRLKRDGKRVALNAETPLPVAVPGFGKAIDIAWSVVPADDEESLGPFSALDGAMESLEHDSAEPAPLPLPLPLASAPAAASSNNGSATPAVAGLAWYCWEGWGGGGELVCDWGDGEEYCYYDGWDVDGEWWYCDDECYVNWDGYYYWRWCECPPGYYWDDWSWECYPDGEEYELSVGGTGAGSGTVYSDVGGISCDITGGTAEGACSDYYFGTEGVTLSASAWEGSTFSGWSGDCSGSGDCYVAMSGARNVTASFSEQQAIVLQCSNTSPQRGEGTNCTASAPAGTTLAVTAWIFDAPAPFGHNRGDGATSTTWGGTMVVSGTIRVEGTINGAAATPGTTAINVGARNWQNFQPYESLVEGSAAQGGLSAEPKDWHHLGLTFFDSGIEAGVNELIQDGGPNGGFGYMLDQYTEFTWVYINRPVFVSGSVFVNRHPVQRVSPWVVGSHCSRPDIRINVQSLVELHEGITGFESGSHTERYYSRLANFNLGPLVEGVVTVGSVSVHDVRAAVGTAQSSAEAQSALNDTGANNVTSEMFPGPGCQPNWY